MSALVVCVSVSRGNTRKVANVLAAAFGATVAEPEEVVPADVPRHDLIALGSGIYYSRVHPRLRRFVASLPDGDGAKVVLFATSGHRELFGRFTRSIERQLRCKNYDVIGSFVCRGWDTWLPLRPFGGMNRGRPDENDLARGRDFADEVLITLGGRVIT